MCLTFCAASIVFALFTFNSNVKSPSVDDIKRGMIVSQFKKKLMEHLSELNNEQMLVGASHGLNRHQRRLRTLKNVHELRVLSKDSHSTVSKIIIPGLKADKCLGDKKQCFEFNLPNSLSPSRITSAKLIIHFSRLGIDILTWQIEVSNSLKTIKKNYRNLSNTKLQTLFITDLLRSSMNNPYSSLEGRNVMLRLGGQSRANDPIKVTNILLLITVKDISKRYRRSTGEGSTKMCTNLSYFCCMKSFSITPNELSMSNLISPELIQLNYCKGDCNDQTILQTNHAMALLQLKRSKTSTLTVRQHDSIKSCCSPQIYSKILVRYRDFQTQQLKETEMNDMVVSSCGCF